MMRYQRNCDVEVEVRITTVIRILPGASYFYQLFIWNIVKIIVFGIYESAVSEMLQLFNLDCFPLMKDESERLTGGFASSRLATNPLYECVCFLHGVTIRKPRTSDCPETTNHFHQKVFYVLLFKPFVTRSKSPYSSLLKVLDPGMILSSLLIPLFLSYCTKTSWMMGVGLHPKMLALRRAYYYALASRFIITLSSW